MSRKTPTVEQPASAALTVAGTPIGNLGDATDRLRTALATADVICAEDTRRARSLCQALNITPRGILRSYHEHNEQERTAEIVETIHSGGQALLITDAGMPAVSDPGYRLIAACIAAGLPVTGLPGPSAPLLALVLSGLPTDRWSFEGFVPRKGREKTLTSLAADTRTIIFFESPHRLHSTLQVMATAFGPDRPAAVARELTKKFEEIRRGSLGELAEWAQEGVRGEITIVVGGADNQAAANAPALAAAITHVQALCEAGLRAKEACALTAAYAGLKKNQLYEAVIHSNRAK